MPDSKISALPVGVALTGTEAVPCVQGGTTVQIPSSYFFLSGQLPQFIATKSIAAASNKGAFAYGTLPFSDTNIVASYQVSVNSFFQEVLQNTNNGATASTDIVLNNDQGTATTNYINLGINSSGFTGSGSFNQPGYGYLATTSVDLVIGTTTANNIHFAINGGATDAGQITSTGLNACAVGASTASTGAFTTLSASSTVSGSGFSTYLASPPAIGGTSAAAGTFTALTATTVNKVTITAPASAATLTLANNKTFTVSNTLTLAGTDATTMTFPPASSNIGYLNVPQNSKSVNYTTVAADEGKHIFHPAADANARTFTIDSNANVPYELGAAITFINRSANNVTIAITADTLTLSPGGTTGSRTLAQYGVATAIKINTTEWIISGTGLS